MLNSCFLIPFLPCYDVKMMMLNDDVKICNYGGGGARATPKVNNLTTMDEMKRLRNDDLHMNMFNVYVQMSFPLLPSQSIYICSKEDTHEYWRYHSSQTALALPWRVSLCRWSVSGIRGSSTWAVDRYSGTAASPSAVRHLGRLRRPPMTGHWIRWPRPTRPTLSVTSSRPSWSWPRSQCRCPCAPCPAALERSNGCSRWVGIGRGMADEEGVTWNRGDGITYFQLVSRDSVWVILA